MNTDHLEKLTLDRVGKLADGQVADALDGAIAAVLNDLRRRPENRNARKVVLTLSIAPGSGRHAEVRCEVKPVLPGRTPPSAALVVELGKQDPELLFNPFSATHIDQLPLPLDGEPAAEAPPARKPRKGA